MDDQLDVPLEDAVLLEEVELISTLIIAASDSEGHLDTTEIDRLLGVPGSDASVSDVPGQTQPRTD